MINLFHLLQQSPLTPARLRHLLLNSQVVNYKILTFRSILTHEKLQELSIGISLLHDYRLKPHILPDEMSKLIRRYLTEALESGYLRVRPRSLIAFCLSSSL